MASPSAVFTRVTASAPASRTAAAMGTRSATIGVSLAHRGRPQAAVASTASAAVSGNWANMARPWCRFGQLRLTSTATTSGGASANRAAAAAYSSTVRPQMLATTVAPVASSGGSSSRSHTSTPGPWRPTELSMPPWVSCTRGAGLPGHGSADSDLTTTAPSADRST